MTAATPDLNEHLRHINGVAPDGKVFHWGRIVATHTVGIYQIVEFTRQDHNPDVESSFHPYINGRDTNHSYSTIEEAITAAIAIHWDDMHLNTQAHRYFLRAIRFPLFEPDDED